MLDISCTKKSQNEDVLRFFFQGILREKRENIAANSKTFQIYKIKFVEIHTKSIIQESNARKKVFQNYGL